MKKFFGFLILALVLFLPNIALAQEGQKVAVAPFKIVAEGAQLEQLSRVNKGLMDVVVQGLSTQGFIPLSMGDRTMSDNLEAVKVQAKQLGADYLFIGAMSRTDDRFSLTGELLALHGGGKSSQRVNVTANTMENLPQTTERLLLMATDHLFGGGAKVVSVQIVGSKIIENQAILNTLRITTGGTYNDAKATSDIKRIHSLGYFDDVQVQVSDVSGGKAVKFIVVERPQIGSIVFKGSKKFPEKDLIKILGLKTFDMANDANISKSIEGIKRLYTEKGYPAVEITTSTEATDDGKVALTYHINEGGKIYVAEIVYDGNETFSKRKLNQSIKSNTQSMISWLTGSGRLDREKLSSDAQALEDFYQNQGFLNARVGDPSVEAANEDGGLKITFPLVEGERFRVGNLYIDGNTLENDNIDKMVKSLNIRHEKYLSRAILQSDLQGIQTYYADQGYANNQVEPVLSEPSEDNKVDITFMVDPRHLVNFDRITIVGNAKTRDKVVRRSLALAEGDLFSASKVQKSKDALMRSTYYQDVNIVPGPSDSDDKMNLRVEVKERPTGAFQIGAGYSNYNSIFGMARITQDNLFGYGRRISLEANVGSKTSHFDFTFTDPWVLDMPLAFNLDIFKYYTKYDTYRKESTGGSVRLGYPIWENFYLSGRLTREDIEVTDVESTSSIVIRDMKGGSVDTTYAVSLDRDTRNHFFNPTGGSKIRLTYEVGTSLLGGDTAFDRYEAEGAKWFEVPLWRGASFMVHGEIGYQEANKERGIPVYEKYMLGGINNVRGYDWYSIGPRDSGTIEVIGGDKMMVFNFEFTFPLLEEEGLFGVAFFDMGEVWAGSNAYKLKDMRKSYGGGLRYLSPLGPFRIEYGRALDRLEGDPSGRWEFTMGSMF